MHFVHEVLTQVLCTVHSTCVRTFAGPYVPRMARYSPCCSHASASQWGCKALPEARLGPAPVGLLPVAVDPLLDRALLVGWLEPA